MNAAPISFFFVWVMHTLKTYRQPVATEPEGGIGCEQVAFGRVPCAALEMADYILEPSSHGMALPGKVFTQVFHDACGGEEHIFGLEQQAIET